MLKPFVCGAGNFEQDDDEVVVDQKWISNSKLKRSSRSFNSRRRNFNKNSKNPYTTSGLDTFATILADLDERRQKIYDTMNINDVSMVRFGYSSSKGWVPIVVKLKDKGNDKPKRKPIAKDEESCVLVPKANRSPLVELKAILEDEKSTVDTCVWVPKSDRSPPVELNTVVQEEKTTANLPKTREALSWSSIMDLVKWKGPSNYLLTVFVIILFCVVLHGRSLSIVCTTIYLYFMPKSNPTIIRRKPVMKTKKKYIRSLTEKAMKNDDGLSSPKYKKHRHGSPAKHGNKSS